METSSAPRATIRTCRPRTWYRRIFWSRTAPAVSCAWPATIQPGKSAARSTRWPIGPLARMPCPRTRSRPRHKLGSYATVAADCLHLLPCAAQRQRRRRALLRGQNEQDCIACHNGVKRLSDGALRQRVSGVRHAQGRASISHLDQSARCRREPHCSTTTVMPPAWTATMRMDPRRSDGISSSAADPHLAEGRRGHQRHRRNHRAYARHQSI